MKKFMGIVLLVLAFPVFAAAWWNPVPGTWVPYIVFDNTSFDEDVQPKAIASTMFWDTTHHTIAFKNDVSADTTLEIGQEQWVYSRNTTASIITDGQVVHVSGATGHVPNVALADASAESTSYVLGVATMDIPINGFGWITTFGLIHGFDTSTFSAGDPLFLSADTPGGLVAVTDANIKAPNHRVFVGTTLDDKSNGTLFVHAGVGYEIYELHDVNDDMSPNNGDILVWDDANKYWTSAAP